MTRPEYKAEAEKILGWPLNTRQLDILVDMAKSTGSGKLVLENFKMYLDRNEKKSVDSFLQWWIDQEPGWWKEEPEQFDLIS